MLKLTNGPRIYNTAMNQKTFRLAPTPPYDFDLTAGYLTYFRGRYAAERYEAGVFRRLLESDGKLLLASVESAGTVESPSLDVHIQGEGLDDADVERAKQKLACMLAIDDDLAAFYQMARADSHLAPFAEAMHGLHAGRTASVYEGLVLSILGQQISTHVARMLRTLLIETYGQSITLDGEKYFAFPRPDTLVQAGLSGLRDIKFSVRKAEYVVEVASRVASGELDLEGMRHMPSDEVMQSLTSIRGIGPWTVHWLMIHALGHPDGFPYGDLALQRFMGTLVNGGTRMPAQEALEYSVRWSPHRSYATAYMFAAGRCGRFDDIAGSV